MKSCDKLLVAIEQIPPQGLHLDGRVSAGELGIEDTDRIRCRHPVQFDLQTARVRTDVLVEGHVDIVLQCRCDRCLVWYDESVSVDDVCHLFENPTETVVDLTEGIREDILLSFPQTCLCKEDCRGLCPTCGQNLNEEVCSCPPRESGNALWHALENLDIAPTPPD